MKSATATVCMMAKDEAPYLVEWLAHYLALGFDRLVVYDNGSTDTTSDVMRICCEVDPRIAVHPWPDLPGRIPQNDAYQHALEAAKTEWIAYFDADELLVLKQHNSIQSFLARYDEGTGAIAINWLLFGSSGEAYFRDELQATRFRMCASNAVPGTENNYFKTIARVSHAGVPRPHSVSLARGLYFTDECQPVEGFDTSNPAKTRTVSHTYAQLNHYVVRSRRECEQKKARGNAARAPEAMDKFTSRGADYFERYDTNHVEDRAIEPWIARGELFRRRFKAALSAQK